MVISNGIKICTQNVYHSSIFCYKCIWPVWIMHDVCVCFLLQHEKKLWILITIALQNIVLITVGRPSLDATLLFLLLHFNHKPVCKITCWLKHWKAFSQDCLYHIITTWIIIQWSYWTCCRGKTRLISKYFGLWTFISLWSYRCSLTLIIIVNALGSNDKGTPYIWVSNMHMIHRALCHRE